MTCTVVGWLLHAAGCSKGRGYRNYHCSKCEGSKTQFLEASMRAFIPHPPQQAPLLSQSNCTARDAQNHAILVLDEQQGAVRCGSDVAGPHCAPLPSCGPSGKLLGCMLVTSRQASHMLSRPTAPREATPGWRLMTPVPREGNVKSQVKQELPRSPLRVCSALPTSHAIFDPAKNSLL